MNKCKWCDDVSFRKQGRIWLCQKHYRFQQMRVLSKRRGVYVPSYEELENMLRLCKGFRCVPCGRTMNWMGRDGQATVITLQHDRSGKVRFLCRSCNTRHATFDGDTFYDIPKAKHPCRSCLVIKNKTEFYKDRSRPLGIKPYCKECANKKHVDWSKKHAKRLAKWQREYRASLRAKC